MIKISNVNKNFGDASVLHDITLSVTAGEIYGLVGESGTGKSTILRCINGLISYDSGEIKVDGVEVKSLKGAELREFRKGIGMIFQQYSLLERLTVYENIAFPLRIWGHSAEEIDAQTKKMLAIVGLENKIKSMPKELSGGQKQRVAIARSLVLNPKLLLSDESTSALDPKIGQSILTLLKDINQELGVTIILVTHQMEAVRQICDRMAILESGNIVLGGTVKEVFLSNSKAFQNLLGKEDTVAKHNCSLLRVLVEKDKGYTSFFSDFSHKTGIDFRYLSGGIESFKDGDAFLGSIEVDSKTLPQAEKYLTASSIRYEVLNHEV